jgi:uncharacterized membrane protein YhaH (DUF805 family)
MDSFFGFSGRIGRGQWWLGQLLNCLGWAIGLMFAAEATKDTGRGLLWMLAGASIVLAVWINLSGTVQRYHDRGKSGFWFFINLIPLIGFIIFFVELAFFPGTDGSNRYGPPPGSESKRNNAREAEGDFEPGDADALIARHKAERPSGNSALSNKSAATTATRASQLAWLPESSQQP